MMNALARRVRTFIPPGLCAVGQRAVVCLALATGSADAACHTHWRDDFTGATLDRGHWQTIFHGPSSNGAFMWSDDNVRIEAGGLVISMQHSPDGWTAGGISQGGPGTRFGLYQIRARAEAGHGVGPVVLLWPASNRWPGPELDLMESPDGDRSRVWTSQHWRNTNGGNAWVSTAVHIDATQWHVYAVDWRPGSLRFLIDGAVVQQTTDNVPDDPAWIALQGFVAGPTDKWYGSPADEATPQSVRMYVDWVEVIAACLPGEHP